MEAAKALGVPDHAGVALFAEIRPEWSVSHNWMLTFAETLVAAVMFPASSATRIPPKTSISTASAATMTRLRIPLMSCARSIGPPSQGGGRTRGMGAYCPSALTPEEMDLWQSGVIRYGDITANETTSGRNRCWSGCGKQSKKKTRERTVRKMTGTQYKNVAQWTLANGAAEASESAAAAKAIFDNMGVPFPAGSCGEILLTLMSEDYMGWRACTHLEAQEYANAGTAAVGIDGEHVVVILPEEGEDLVGAVCPGERHLLCPAGLRHLHRRAHHHAVLCQYEPEYSGLVLYLLWEFGDQ